MLPNCVTVSAISNMTIPLRFRVLTHSNIIAKNTTNHADMSPARDPVSVSENSKKHALHIEAVRLELSILAAMPITHNVAAWFGLIINPLKRPVIPKMCPDKEGKIFQCSTH